jgi:hypothetical protein
MLDHGNVGWAMRNAVARMMMNRPPEGAPRVGGPGPPPPPPPLPRMGPPVRPERESGSQGYLGERPTRESGYDPVGMSYPPPAGYWDPATAPPGSAPPPGAPPPPPPADTTPVDDGAPMTPQQWLIQQHVLSVMKAKLKELAGANFPTEHNPSLQQLFRTFQHLSPENKKSFIHLYRQQPMWH